MATRTVGDLLRDRAREHPDRPFLRCGDDQLTFAEADERSDRVAAGLTAVGVERGDRVALVVPNRLETLELLFACAKGGFVQVPVNVYLKGEFLRYQLDDAQASTIVVDAAGAKALAPIADGLPHLKRVILLDDAEFQGNTCAYGALPDGGVPRPDLGPADILSIVYTSGTTGMPKGCMLSHAYHVLAAQSSKEMLGYTPDDVVYTALPLFHQWARGIVLGALVHGFEAVVDPEFSASGALRRIIEVGATVFAGVGAMGAALMAQPPSDDDRRHTLRVAFMIPFPPGAERAFTERFGTPVLSQMYGQTETGAVTFAALDSPRTPGTVGRPSPAFEVRLVDDDDNDVEPGDVGEIAVRPRWTGALYSGYWRKPDETLEAWRNLWHHTGDYGRASDDGTITFVDRKSDALRRRGENVSSLELEAAIARHPLVAEVAVHAVPSEMTEDDIKACIVAEPGADLDPGALAAFFRDTLPYYAIPRYVELVETLPRTATMRVLKHELRTRGVTAETWDLEVLGLTVEKAERR